MANLLKILSRYTKEDALQMEHESKFPTDSKNGLSPNELWEIEKLKQEPKLFDEFKNSFNKTIKLDE